MRIRNISMGQVLLVCASVFSLTACGDSDDNGTAPGPRGDFTVRTTTTGVEQDSEYGVAIDDIFTRTRGANDSSTWEGVSVDTYALELVEVRDNCIVAPENPRLLTLVADDIVETTFEVECFETLGILEVVTETTGESPDVEYSLAVDGTAVGTIGANDTARTADLVTGDHTLELGSIAVNCVLTGDALRTVAVPSQGTATSIYEVFCTDQVGDLRIVTETTGFGDPDGFEFRVLFDDPVLVQSDSSVVVESVAIGVARVELIEESVLEFCTYSGPNPRSVEIRQGEVSETTFQFECRGAS